MSHLVRLAAIAAAATLLATPLPAQGAPDSAAARQQRTLDSLAAAVRGLRSRLDSLAGVRDDSGAAVDAIRAAARAAGGERAPQPEPARPQGSSLNALNPEISATGDLRAALLRPGPQTETFEARHVEFAVQSALDPYSTARIYVGLEGGQVHLEEAYVFWSGLPASLRLDAGLFRQQLGELNRWHLHALPEGEYPLVLRRYLGEEGLAQAGVSLLWPLPLPARLGAFELTAQATRGTNEALFGAGRREEQAEHGDDETGRASWLAHLSGFWQLSRSTYVQLGATGMYGSNPDTGLTTRLGAVSARFTWRPPAEGARREVTLRGELFVLQRRFDGVGPTRLGGYAGAQVRLGRRWVAGVRGDWVESADPDAPGREWAVSPTLTFWQSEFVFLRAQWTRARDTAGSTGDRFGLQAVFSMGPHKHETF